MEFGLLAAALIAAVCVRLTLAAEAATVAPEQDSGRLWDLALLSAFVGLGVGRIGAMVAGGTNPLAHPLDVLILRGGVEVVLASVTALVAFGVAARRDLVATADAVAPAAIAGLVGWHGGCFTRGACLGTPSDLPWAISGPSGVGRHPVELYAALLLVVGGIALVLLKARHPRPGVIAGLAIGIASGARLVTEPMRLGIGTSPLWWYAGGVAAGGAGVVAAVVAGRRRG